MLLILFGVRLCIYIHAKLIGFFSPTALPNDEDSSAKCLPANWSLLVSSVVPSLMLLKLERGLSLRAYSLFARLSFLCFKI